MIWILLITTFFTILHVFISCWFAAGPPKTGIVINIYLAELIRLVNSVWQPDPPNSWNLKNGRYFLNTPRINPRIWAWWSREFSAFCPSQKVAKSIKEVFTLIKKVKKFFLTKLLFKLQSFLSVGHTKPDLLISSCMPTY